MAGYWDTGGGGGSSSGGSSSTSGGGSSSGGGGGYWNTGAAGSGVSKASAAGGGGGGGGIFSSIVHGLGSGVSRFAHIVEGVPAGLAALGRDTAKSVGYDTGHGFMGGLKSLFVGLPQDQVNQHPHGLGENLVANLAPNVLAAKQPGESQQQAQARAFPAVAGIAQGLKQSGDEIVHPSQLVANYKRDPVGSLINDAANASLLLGGAGAGLGRVAEAADSARLGSIASKVGAAGGAAEKVASAPFLPFKAVGKLSALAGDAAYGKVMDTPVGERPPAVASLLQGLSPNVRSFGRQVVEGEAKAQNAATLTNRVAANAAAELPQTSLQHVAALVGEGEAPALAHLRDTAPQTFDQFVTDRYKGAVTPETAHLAADVAAGHNPELAAKIDAYFGKLDQGIGPNRVGSVADREARYVSAHPEQGGFAPNQQVIDQATEKAMSRLPAAQAAARDLAARTAKAETALANAKADLSEAVDQRGKALAERKVAVASEQLQRAVQAQQERSTTAMDRLTSAQDRQVAARVTDRQPANLQPVVKGASRFSAAADRVQRVAEKLDAAKQKAAAAEDTIVRKGEQASADGLRKQLVEEVKNYRRQAAGRARQVADQMGEVLQERPEPPASLKRMGGIQSPMHDVANQLREELGSGWAGRNLFAARGAGVPLDVWLKMWNDRRQVVPEILSGEDLATVAHDAADYLRAHRDLKGAASGLIANGAEGSALRRLMEDDPHAEMYLRGTPQEAAARLEQEFPGRNTGGADPLGEAFARADSTVRHVTGPTPTDPAALAALSPEERALANEALVKQQAADAARAHGQAAELLQRTVGKVQDAGVREGLPIGRADEQAAQAARVARLESRRLGSLTAKADMPIEPPSVTARPTFGEGSRLGSLETRARVLANLQRNAESRVATIQGGVPAAAEAAANELTSAPSRLRPMLSANRAVNETLGERGLLPHTLSEVASSGQDARYLPHTQETGRGLRVGGDAALPQIRTIGSEKLREGSPVYDRSIKGLAKGYTDRAVKDARLQTVEDIRNHPEAAQLGQGKLAGVTTMADAVARNYVPWDPRTLFGKAGRVADVKDVIANTTDQIPDGKGVAFLPKPLFEKYQTAVNRGDLLGAGGRVFDKATQAFYKGALHASPGFAKMYALQDAGLALTRGGISPADFVTRLSEAAKAIRAGELPELGGRLPLDEQQPGALKTGVRGTLSKVGAAATGGVPKFIDQMARTMVAVDQMAKGATRDDAIMEAQRTMGLYQSASPVERDIIRRVLPIAPWAKHVSQAIAEFAAKDPAKATVLLNFGRMFTDANPGQPSFVAGDLPLGKDKYLDVRDLNPLSILSAPPAGFINPLVRAGLGAATGMNVSHVGTGRDLNLSRPPGQPTGSRPLPLGEALHFIEHQQPLGRILQQIQEKPVARYDTGEPKLPHGKPLPALVGQSPLQRFLGSPFITEKGLTPAQTRKQAAVAKSTSKAAIKYQQARARSGL